MKISICDDEPAVRELIAHKVQKLYPEAELSFFASGEELLLEGETADILFLDIRLNGQDGMETARALRRKNRRMILIFVTALQEYVFQAFDVGAFHYLVKPFEDAKFAGVLHAAVRQWEEEKKHVRWQKEANEEEGENSQMNKARCIWIKTGGLSTKVHLDDIIYAEVLNRKITLHKKDGDLEYYGKLSELEKMVGEDFFRPHRAYLIHFKYVECYNATEIEMERGRAMMAKQNYSAFVKSFMRYNQRKGWQSAYE